MPITVKINFDAIQKKLRDAAIIKSGPIASKKAFFIFARAKGAMLKEFDQHPVTVELRKGGEGAVPITNATDGYGNLFAFIGFEKGSNPTEPLRELLESSNLKPRVRRDNQWIFQFNIPTKQAIEANSQMPWEHGNSWVTELENGSISNLSHFLFQKFNSPEPSRSSMGIQLPYEVNEDLVFQKTPYLTEILKNFREKASNVVTL